MHTVPFRLLALSVAAVLCSAAAHAASGGMSASERDSEEGMLRDGFITDLELMAGVRELPDEVDANGGQAEAIGGGLQYQTRGIDWPVGLHLGGSWFYADGNRLDAQWSEYTIGAFVPFRFGSFRADAVAGGYLYSHRLRPDGAEAERLQGGGGFAQGTLRYLVTPEMEIVAALRYYLAEEEDSALIGKDIDVGGGAAFVGFGLRF